MARKLERAMEWALRQVGGRVWDIKRDTGGKVRVEMAVE